MSVLVDLGSWRRPSAECCTERIGRRFAAMLAAVVSSTEVRALRARGDLHTGLPVHAGRGVSPGLALSGWRVRPARSWSQRGIVATRQFAKRQLTWLRRKRDALVVRCRLTAGVLQRMLSVNSPPVSLI
ncbi:MAG: hypothetical protein U5L11_11220 [Arhodomonas sp.]|nr:hypothetical protein [Arhodomonas sp.]